MQFYFFCFLIFHAFHLEYPFKINSSNKKYVSVKQKKSRRKYLKSGSVKPKQKWIHNLVSLTSQKLKKEWKLVKKWQNCSTILLLSTIICQLIPDELRTLAASEWVSVFLLILGEKSSFLSKEFCSSSRITSTVNG